MATGGLTSLWEKPVTGKILSLAFLQNGHIVAIIEKLPGNKIVVFDQTGDHDQLQYDSSRIANPIAVTCGQTSSSFAIAHGEFPHYMGTVFQQTSRNQPIRLVLDTWPVAISWDGTAFCVVSGHHQVLTRQHAQMDMSSCDRSYIPIPTKPSDCRKELGFECWNLTMDNHKRLIIPHGEQVSVYRGSDLQKEFTFPRQSERHLLQSATAVCTDSKCNIFVADKELEAVLVFSPEGLYKNKLYELHFKPTHMALWGTKLAVATESHSIALFEIN